MNSPPGRHDEGAAVIADSPARPEVFGEIHHRHAAVIHRYAARRGAGAQGHGPHGPRPRGRLLALLDPETFVYRGVRWVAGTDYYVGGKASGGPFMAKGAVLATATRVATVVVDKAGERN
ncbi:hypothetical protein B6E66_31740 [Streptomyces maremycinicus]|nr:hypothetical protein B6E66_31740 [Streptomyces sp. B9173]